MTDPEIGHEDSLRSPERAAEALSRRVFLRTTAGIIGVSSGLATAWRVAAQASGPVRGGVLKVALSTEPSSLDNHQTTDTLVAFTMWHVHETLFTWDTNFQPVPLLARSHEASRDGLVHAITLREQVRFHNGEEMTAVDVVASIQRWGGLSSLGKSLMAATREILATGRYKVEIRLKEPFATVVVALGRGSQGCAIYPKSLIEASGSGPLKTYVGTGPYRFVERQTDRFIRVRRYDGYVSPPGPPNGYGGHKSQYVDQIDFIPVPDEAARLAGLRAGDFHYLERFSTDEYETLRREPNIATQVLPPVEWPVFVLNTKSPVLANMKIRQAFQAALDHEAILQAGYGKGFYRLDPSLMFKETAWHTTAGQELYNARGREKAKGLLQDARYDGTPVRFLSTQDYKNMYNEAVVAQQQLEAVGFKVQPVVSDWSTMLKTRGDEKGWEVFVTGFVFRVDPSALPFLPTCSWFGWWCTERKVALVKQLQQGMDFKTRYKVFEDIQRAFYEEVPAIKVGDGHGVTAISAKLKGFDGRIQLEPEFSNVWLER
jgi:peptide/nickel transport system substrate-binding protein